MKKMILIGVGALALVGVSVGASLFLTGALNKEPVAAAAVEEEPLPEEVYYYNVQPEFVVNFKGKTRVKFLMIEMVVASHDEEVPVVLSDHDPELRNSLLMLLAEQDSEVLKTAEGKQALRDSAMARIDEVVSNHYKPERILDVFITRLVMQ
ncbi:flagellar basal body-associated FliL family protein [Granulosicoccus sp. 3-233]|uniref:flagellar basal body-associated FliL family protein n=1 Tax=Granulosicoccus sp. 3-233 TaxID=3417969 RepID=UPI003D3561A4